VAFEYATASVNGALPQPYILRVTTVFRREHGGWKIVHRHADPRASESASELMEQLSPPDRQTPPSARWSAMPTRAWPARISPRSACHRWTVPIRPQPYRTADIARR